MGSRDIDDMLAFARTLPSNDLMFLRVNITDRPIVEHWVESIEGGRTITVLARQDGKVLGESTLLHNEANWTRHLGEIRIQISPAARRRGLARVLAREIDTIARQLGLQLLTARMTLDQSAAQAVFRRLGIPAGSRAVGLRHHAGRRHPQRAGRDQATVATGHIRRTDSE